LFANDDAFRAALVTRQAQRAFTASAELCFGNIAVLPLHGLMVHRASALSVAFGLVSVEAFARSFRAALADETVSDIVLDIDSPVEACGASANWPTRCIAHALASPLRP
jgi:capsid assembly protease